jgi:hypothetical protein
MVGLPVIEKRAGLGKKEKEGPRSLPNAFVESDELLTEPCPAAVNVPLSFSLARARVCLNNSSFRYQQENE